MPEQAQDKRLPYLGFGLRLRREYLSLALQKLPDVDWFEIVPESFVDGDEALLRQLQQLAARYPITLHGISLGIGSPWPLDLGYLEKLKTLIERLNAQWFSDHICWRGADETQGRLLPLPYSRETLEHVVERVVRVQQILERRILLENVPRETAGSTTAMSEAEFVRRVAEESDSLIVVDIANLHASSVNQGFDPLDYLACLPTDRVQQIHLAGAVILCELQETPADPVWELYLEALKRFGRVSTLIERVDTIASLEEMVQELHRARCSVSELLTSG